jgi:hypothetical protein
MIKNIIAMLAIDNFYGISENIDIAKGKYVYTSSFRKLTRQEIRKNARKKLTNG